MNIDVTQELKQINGDPLLDNDGKGNAIPIMLRSVIVNAILHPVDKELGMEKVKKYKLATNIYNNDSVDLSSEEVTLIKDRVGALLPPLVVGQVFEMLGE